jgi:hypothetical protein
MKKLLIIFLLSFAFLGSANANSIEGAFGYKLGQIVKNIPNVLWTEFSPKKPLLSLNEYSIHTTLKEKRIYKIMASYAEQSTVIDKCTPYSSDYAAILKILETKYGDFFNLRNLKHSSDTWRQTSLSEYFIGNNRYRMIELECNWFFDREDPTTYRYSLWLTYTDLDLQSEARREEEELKKKELQEQLKGVDY